MKSILSLLSPSSSTSPSSSDKKVDDDDGSYSDAEFEEEEHVSPDIKTARSENTDPSSLLTTSVTPVTTKEAGDDDLNDFLNGLSSSSSEEEEEKDETNMNKEVMMKEVEKTNTSLKIKNVPASPPIAKKKKKKNSVSTKLGTKKEVSSPPIKNKHTTSLSQHIVSKKPIKYKRNLPSSKLLSTKDKEEAVVWRRLHDALKDTASPPVSALREIQDQFTENDHDDLGYVTSRCFLNILEPWTRHLKISKLQLSSIVTALVRDSSSSSSPSRTDSLIQYGLFMAAMWMRSSVVPVNDIPPSSSLSPPRNDVSVDSPDQVTSSPDVHLRARARPKTAAASRRRSPLISRLRCRAVYGGGNTKKKKKKKKKKKNKSSPELSSPSLSTASSPGQSDVTVTRLRSLVREKQQAVEALRKIAKREENHVHMLKTWSKPSIENISEIEKLLRRRKKDAGKEVDKKKKKKKKKKKTTSRSRRAIKSYLWERADAMISKGQYEGEVLEAILDSYWQNKREVSPTRRNSPQNSTGTTSKKKINVAEMDANEKKNSIVEKDVNPMKKKEEK